jgi:hypothetical protein
MTDELENIRNKVVMDYILSQRFWRNRRKILKASERTARVPALIRIDHLPNTSVQRYLYLSRCRGNGDLSVADNYCV